MSQTNDDRQPANGPVGGLASHPADRRWVLIGGLLAVPVLLPLLVGTYARTTPELAGVPFYFWWQFVLIIVSAVFTVTAYLLVIRLERARHEREGSATAGGEQP